MSQRRGWCPTLYEPMETGDGLLVRVKPRGGRLDAAAAQALADAAERFGNGMIDLTARAGLQVRGLRPECVAPFAAAMVAAGLASADPAAERRRSVIATPLAGLDPDAHPETAALTDALERALETADGLSALPSKFGFEIDGGGAFPPAAAADIGIQLRGTTAWLTLDGAETAAAVPLPDAVRAALRLAGAFVRLAGEGASGLRMHTLLAAIGAAPIWAASGVHAGPVSVAAADAAPGVGRHERLGVFGAGLRFGSAHAAQWRQLAAMAAASGGPLRLSPGRVVFVGLSPGVEALLESAGLVIDPHDPVLRVSACPGDPFCATATVATRDLASLMRPAPGETVHVSGCSKGCAHPQPATRTLVGRDGLFDLVRHGRAADRPALLGLTAAEALRP